MTELKKKQGRKIKDNADIDNKNKIAENKTTKESGENAIENTDTIEGLSSNDSAMDSIDSLNDLDLNYSEEIPTDRIDPLQEEQALGQIPPPPPQTDFKKNQDFPEAQIQEEIIEQNQYDIPAAEPESQSNNTNEDHEKVVFEEPSDTERSPKKKVDKTSIKKTAEAILNVYENVLPLPFKSISKFNVGKMQNMDLAGEIRMNMQVKEDGTTIQDFVEEFNNSVDEIFVITPEMKEEVREPLEDVLAEKGIALTPMQRLLIAVGSHIVAFGYQAINLNMQNKNSMNTFREFRNEEIKAGVEPQSATPKPNASSQNKEEVKPQTEEKKDEEQVIIPEEIKNSDEMTMEGYIGK